VFKVCVRECVCLRLIEVYPRDSWCVCEKMRVWDRVCVCVWDWSRCNSVFQGVCVWQSVCVSETDTDGTPVLHGVCERASMCFWDWSRCHPCLEWCVWERVCVSETDLGIPLWLMVCVRESVCARLRLIQVHHCVWRCVFVKECVCVWDWSKCHNCVALYACVRVWRCVSRPSLLRAC